jgi:hypothetical protein
VEKFKDLTDKQLLTLLIYGEARGEPVEGQIAVASVVRNRVKISQKLGLTWRDIILKPRQFSCFNEDDPNYPKLCKIAEGIFDEPPLIRQIIWVAEGILYDRCMDNTKGATHYVTKKLFLSSEKPSWVNKMAVTAEIGSHVFMKER